MILDKINKPNDIKKIPWEDYPELAEEIRNFLIEHLSKTGGHLASNLGVVELTMALHQVLDLPEDKIVWDVGHQCYTHKILTGRKEGFEDLRCLNGMSGFPKRGECDCDCFDTGHSSTSISAGLGYVKARDLLKKNYRVVSVIGDGAMTGGMAFEALNNAGDLKTNFIIVLNDNEMSISENVGGMSMYLSGIRTRASYTELKANVETTLNKIPVVGKPVAHTMKRTKNGLKQFFIPGMLFENMGVTYLGPVDGHNPRMIAKLLQEAKRVEGAVLVHVVTQKGRGYEPAVRHPARFHGTAPFEIKTGLPLCNSSKAGYTDIFSTVMRKLGDRRKDVVAVSAAMLDGTGLKRFRNLFPERCFDVGIAEEHAVTFAAALSLGGMTPIVAVYSSFLQRAMDQILHDVCMQKVHVIFAIDRAGLVGSDGETHHGCFDLTYLSMMPNMTLMAPKNKWELSDMIKFALDESGPVAIRYPRGEAYDGLKEFRAPVVCGKSEILYEESQIVLLAVGNMVKIAEEVRNKLIGLGRQASLVNVRFIKPLDTQMLDWARQNHSLIVTMEENVITGGFGQQVADYYTSRQENVRILHVAVPDEFIEHGNVKQLFEKIGLDAKHVVERIIAEEENT